MKQIVIIYLIHFTNLLYIHFIDIQIINVHKILSLQYNIILYINNVQHYLTKY